MTALLIALSLWAQRPTIPLENPTTTTPGPCAGGNAEDVTGPWPKL